MGKIHSLVKFTCSVEYKDGFFSIGHGMLALFEPGVVSHSTLDLEVSRRVLIGMSQAGRNSKIKRALSVLRNFVHLSASFFISASWRKENNGRSHLTLPSSTFFVGLAAAGSIAIFSASVLATRLVTPAMIAPQPSLARTGSILPQIKFMLLSKYSV